MLEVFEIIEVYIMERIGFLLFTITLAALIVWKMIVPDYRRNMYE